MSTNHADDDHAHKLCLSCGVCCDGTLFGSVGIGELERALYEKAGVAFKFSADSKSFCQPCPAHDSGCCQIYLDRPTICHDYKCTLLASYLNNEVTYVSASELITLTHELKRSISAYAEELGITFKIEELDKMLLEVNTLMLHSGDNAMKTIYGGFCLQIFAFKHHVERHFKKERDENTKPERAEMSVQTEA